jgi:hypothetical protein
VITALAPDCRISGTFSCSRTAATIQASGLSWRAVSVVSTLESSRLVVMMTWLASDTPARRSTSRRVGVPGDDGEAVRVGVLQGDGTRVDDDDGLAVLPVVDQRLDRAAALGA